MSKSFSAPLNARNLENLQLNFVQKPQTKDLEYPLHDSSSGVTNFEEWSYFKKRSNEKAKIISSQSTTLFCPALLERINKHAIYFNDYENHQDPIRPVKSTVAHRLRVQVSYLHIIQYLHIFPLIIIFL